MRILRDAGAGWGDGKARVTRAIWNRTLCGGAVGGVGCREGTRDVPHAVPGGGVGHGASVRVDSKEEFNPRPALRAFGFEAVWRGKAELSGPFRMSRSMRVLMQPIGAGLWQ
jgi:hypothetical protein